MNIAICEDNKAIASEVENYILNLGFRNMECDIFYSGDKLISYLLGNETAYQIYFLDIIMPGINGIETAQKIREKDTKAIIIFMTDYKDYVFHVFEVLPFRFLIKPVTQEKIDIIVYDAIEYLCSSKKFFFFSVENTNYQVPFEDIIYFESNKRKIRMVTNKEEHLFYDKLSNVEQKLDNNFFARIHVSYLINFENLCEVETNKVRMINSDILPISMKYQKTIKENHMNYIKWRSGL
ncbi:LytR/AlgR family response regulator transcription factor [Anaerocolumna sp. MB42-C2]|uniref:LytR/AlgR family response regulator transcription factor n=1 Tax=Anaerocolumna sp. MB42-C2 TaxID=3070997 RepID=UPI0027DF2522|nr:LytTR family DNA-binding domain-containing protein [Anaerocolumna sp. MB42-C2]WMJ89081.1 LytTR family DNA-binding domain-containing protein [Anaerocolumna sp. MB42-C2]